MADGIEKARMKIQPVFVICVASVLSMAIGNSANAQNRTTIVLRDLSVLSDSGIESFNDNRVLLTDGTSLTWDAILRADVPDESRAEFDRRISQIGLPMFRIKSRLESGDWWSIASIAEPMYSLVKPGGDSAGFQFDAETRYLISLAAMYGRIQSGNREAAVEPFLLAASLQPQIGDDIVPEYAFTQREINSLISSKLLPVWFDQENAGLAVDDLSEHIGPGGFPAIGGVLVYRASLATAAGRLNVVREDIEQLRQQGSHPDWVKVLEARLLFSQDRIDEGLQLLRGKDTFDPACRAVALYLEGMHPSPTASSSDASLVSLLTIPAIFGETFEEISSAALYGAAERSGKEGNVNERRILTNELLRRYPNTYHGRLAAANEK
ncbi:MAG: hypothetical protein AAF456_23190 [Planctomycetota bacterium]